MRGVILAGGKGTRLMPLTKITNKHLLPIANRTMMEYPLGTLLDAGINDIMIISGREHAGDFVEYFGSGRDFGARFTYTVQEEAGGIAQALLLAADFARHGQDPNITVILGDNIFEKSFYRQITQFRRGAKIFLKEVPDPQRFGVAVFRGNKVSRIIEKPVNPPTQFAVTGLYVYDEEVFEIIRDLKPSARGELEITDVNNVYAKRKRLSAEFVEGFWSDAGTFPSLARATEWAMKRSNET